MATVFLAGATGAIGTPLARLLAKAGHTVVGSTRKAEKADALKALGATPAIVDVFDATALTDAVTKAKPDIVIHQLTDLPPGLDPALMDAALKRNARIRREGTKHLVDAARAAGAKRFIAQSIAFVYAEGVEPHGESDPLDLRPGPWLESVEGVAALEDLTVNSPPLQGVVLRYARLYGPGTGADGSGPPDRIHVDAAAHAALLAMDKGSGIYNIAEPNPHVAIDKAKRELGFDPGFRLKG